MSKKKPKQEQQDELNFDLEFVVIPVTIGGVKYELREANGDATCRWRNSILNKTKLNDAGKAESIHNIADTEPILVSLCLFPLGKKKNVPVETVRSWPNRVQKKLFEKIKEISELDEDEETKEEVKNEPESTPDG